MAFSNNQVNYDFLINLMHQIPPCDVIICNNQGESLFRLDPSIFTINGHQYTTTDFLKIWQCLMHYVDTHLNEALFVGSDLVNSRCPLYKVCDLNWEHKAENIQLCENKPWEICRDETDSCWYGAAVKSLMGDIEVTGINR